MRNMPKRGRPRKYNDSLHVYWRKMSKRYYDKKRRKK